MSNRKKAIIAIVVVAIVVTTTMLIFGNRPEAGKDTNLVFNTSPRAVHVSVNGTDYGSVEAGTELTVTTTSSAAIEVSQEGFETYSATVELTPGTTNQVHVALLPETDEAWAKVKDEENLQNEQETTENYLKDAEEAYKKYPLLSDLPHEASLFSAYQGLPESAGYDFGLHLHLYAGQEAKGRAAFTQWMTSKNYDPKDYDVVETIKNEAPPTALPEHPTMEQLEETTPDDITIPTNPSAEGLNAIQLAMLFAEVTTTWDTAKDNHHTAALTRATKLMTKDQAGLPVAPERPTTSPTWRAAAQTKARSKSWVSHSDISQQKDGTTKATIKVCWAWIAKDQAPVIDGPRTYELTITSGKPAISKYTYKDPDPFVDNTKTPCLPADA